MTLKAKWAMPSRERLKFHAPIRDDCFRTPRRGWRCVATGATTLVVYQTKRARDGRAVGARSKKANQVALGELVNIDRIRHRDLMRGSAASGPALADAMDGATPAGGINASSQAPPYSDSRRQPARTHARLHFGNGGSPRDETRRPRNTARRRRRSATASSSGASP